MNGLVEDIMRQGDSKLTETNPRYLYEEKLSLFPPKSAAAEVHLFGQAFSMLFIGHYGWYVI